MNASHRCICLVLAAACLAGLGCKKKGTTTPPGTGISPERVDAAREAMTRGMERISFGSLTTGHVGKTCVVTARTMEDRSLLGPPPPPPGMVRLLGETTIYRGQLDAVAAGSLTIRAAYPTPDHYKRLEIAKEDIQSIHLAP